MPAAPVVVSATLTVGTNTAVANNDAIVAAFDSIQVQDGDWVGPPRILYTRGTPAHIAVSRVVQFNLSDPSNQILGSFSVSHLQQQLRTALPGWVVDAPRLATPADIPVTATTTIPVLIHTEAVSALQSQAPLASDITAGFERYSRSSLAENGQWVGPGPRIVRKASPGNNTTYAAWLYEWPDTPWVRQNLSTLTEALQTAVNRGLTEETQRRGTLFNDVRLVPWNAVTATSWREAINGPLSWWRSGQATITRTQTDFPGVASTEFVENPIGPDTAATHPQSSDPFDKAVSAAKVIGGITAAVLGLVYLGPPISAWLKRRANPVGFVRGALLRGGEVVEHGKRIGKIAKRGVVDNKLLVSFSDGSVERVPIQELMIPGERYNPSHSLPVAETILAQMGGPRMAAMIGAKDFNGSPNSLTFKWAAKARNGSSAVTITLDPSDTYTMTFYRRTGWKVVKTIEGVYAEDLQQVFSEATGLALSL